MKKKPETLPEFPVDDETLERLEHACHTTVEIVELDDGRTFEHLVGGDFTLHDLLANLSKHNGQWRVGEEGVPLMYSETDVILALIEHIGELKDDAIVLAWRADD